MASDFIQRQKNDLIRDISALGSLFFYILAGALFLALKDYSSFMKLLVGTLIIYFVTAIIRRFFFRERPQKLSYSNAFEKLDAASFPSLHASRTAFLLVFFINYFSNPLASFIIALLAMGIFYSRTYLRKHDWKDVIGGIVLGVLAYYLAVFVV